MVPGLKLRTVLETLPNLTLARLRLMLRSHYKERSAAELFQQLTNSMQRVEETADEFLIRTYEMRQKLIFARKESGAGTVPYDDSLIQSMFINAIETGITDEAIRSQVRKFLVLPSEGESELEFETINDELIKQVTIATAKEAERKEKIRNVTRRRAEVTEVGVEREVGAMKGQQKEKDPILTAMRDIQSQIGNLKKDVTVLQTNASSSRSTYLRKCRKCQEDKQEQCGHCFRCGSNDHFARGCKSSNSNRT